MDFSQIIDWFKRLVRFRVEGHRASFDLYRVLTLVVLASIFSCIYVIYERQTLTASKLEAYDLAQANVNATNGVALALLQSDVTQVRSDVSDLRRWLLPPRTRQNLTSSLASDTTNAVELSDYTYEK